MPLSERTFDGWPISWTEMESVALLHRLERDDLAGEEGDRTELFPLIAPARPFPAAADRPQRPPTVPERVLAR